METPIFSIQPSLTPRNSKHSWPSLCSTICWRFSQNITWRRPATSRSQRASQKMLGIRQLAIESQQTCFVFVAVDPWKCDVGNPSCPSDAGEAQANAVGHVDLRRNEQGTTWRCIETHRQWLIRRKNHCTWGSSLH